MAENGVNVLEQMNQILADKERVIDEKRIALQKEMDELKAYENELVQKTLELKSAQEALENEKQELAARWEKVEEYEKNLEASMSKVLEEKVNQELKNKEILEKELAVTVPETKEEKLDLNKLRASVGIPVAVTETEVVQENTVDEKKEAEESEEKKRLSEVISRIEVEAAKVYREPKNYVLEVTPWMLCMQIGNKEMRVFVKEDGSPCEVHVVVSHRNAESDTKLKKKFPLWQREIPDWEFVTTANQLVAKMFFTPDTDAKVVVSKVKECIKNIDG